MDADEAWAREAAFWTGDAAAARAALEPDCVMAFPAPAGIIAGAGAILAALEAAPRWEAVDMDGRILAVPDPALRVLAYRAEARRTGGDPYRAFCTSVWRRGAAGWRLVQHQQTPA